MGFRRSQTYEERFLSVSAKWERFLCRLALSGFMGILISQLALSVPEFRQVFSPVDRLESRTIPRGDERIPLQNAHPHDLTIRPAANQSPPAKAWVKVNGVPVAQIGQSGVTIKVRDRDRIEIDTSSQRGVFRFEIDHNDPSIASPTPGTLVESSENHAAVIERVFIDVYSLAH